MFKIPKINKHPIHAEYSYSEMGYKKLHVHDEIQLTLIKKGEGVLLCGANSFPFSPRDLIVLGSNLPHVFTGKEGVPIERISLYFKESWLVNIYPDSNYLHYLIKCAAKGMRLLKWSEIELVEKVLNKDGLYRVEFFLQLLNRLSESKEVIVSENAEISLEKEVDYIKMNEVLKYVSENLAKSITLKEVSSKLDIKDQTLSRYFKLKTNKTLGSYIKTLRIQRACELLESTSLSIDEIRIKVGYRNKSNFYRQFFKVKKITPKQYQNNFK